MKTKSKSKVAAVEAIGAIDYAVINAALEKELDLTLTTKNQALLKRSVGAANYRKIEEIISFASNQDAWMDSNNLSAAADVVSGKLSQQYPLLSPMAAFKIVNQATYGWR